MNQVHRKNQPPAVGNVVCRTISVRWKTSADSQVVSFMKRMEDSGKETTRRGDWIQIESQNGAAPIPDSQLGPRPHSSSLFSKLGIPIHPLVGLISTTSVLGNQPVLTNTAPKRELICCVLVISFLALRLCYALFRAVGRHRRLTQRKKDRRSVCPSNWCRTRADNFGQAHLGADVILVEAPYIRVPTDNPDIWVTGRHYVKKKIPMVSDRPKHRLQPCF